ncbi:MAG: response regulator [Pseudomonadota bacterium]
MSAVPLPSRADANHWPEGFDAAPTILLVDDEPNILSSIRRLLRLRGYAINTTESGEEALKILSTEPVDLIISDMHMPGINGTQLLDKIRQQWPWTIRLLLTGIADISTAIEAINQGEIYRYISKPWNDDELLTTIRCAIERRGLEKEHKRLQILTQQQNQDLKNLNNSLEQKVQARTTQLTHANEELIRANEKVKHNFLTSIKVFSNLIEMRTGLFPGHSRRIADLSYKIAEHMGLTRSLSQNVMLAGLLHGIGKIGFPDALISKPFTQMNKEELDTFKKHPIKGATALMAIDELYEAASIIRQQHERYDEQRSSQKFVESDVYKGAAILTLAIDYDALKLGLKFPRKLSAEEAQTWIIKGKSTLYAPEVVDAFLNVIKQPYRNNFKEKLISSKDLKTGMILERDLLTHDGVLLMSIGHILDDTTISQIRALESSDKQFLKIWIRCL